ncbi:MAG: RNA 3'-terminal phosphate cyclase [Anaerolineae bacterium]|jgi:RNA 3'-terminal phosphate cyclase (ATP)
MIVIDGSYGEGGGQVLRTSLTLAMLTGQTVQIERIRAGRSKPGLAAQHLTCVRAAAAICDASVSGDKMGSGEVRFEPGGPPRAGDYTFDVTQARQAGSAGSVSLILQAVLLPLALAPGPSRLTLRGGTHVSWSPPFPYLDEVYLPTLGLAATLTLKRWGFYPVGGGEIVVQIPGSAPGVRSLTLTERGALRRVWGTAVVSNLPAHIPQRMANRARNILSQQGIEAELQARRVRANGPGAGIFIFTEHEENVHAGFVAYGRKGLPAERVAQAVCQDLLVYCQDDHAAPVDKHLADQLIVPLAIADGVSHFATGQITEHLRTNMWVVEQFNQARFEVVDQTISVHPRHQENAERQP